MHKYISKTQGYPTHEMRRDITHQKYYTQVYKIVFKLNGAMQRDTSTKPSQNCNQL